MRHQICIRKLLSFLTILCCLAGCVVPVHASGSGSEAPRVVFTNEPRNAPDLYVSKEVENAVGGAAYAAPEHAAYRFVLKVNGNTVQNQTYQVFDSEHREIIRKTSNGRENPFRTDRSGVFTLEAGWQACFKLSIGDRYEVIEQDIYQLPKTVSENGTVTEQTVNGGDTFYYKEGNTLIHPQFDYETRSLAADGFQKKRPSGGSTGEHSVLANGSYETFMNRYIGRGSGSTTTLEITKSISFPENYQRPDTTPEFPFVIELNGAPYANERFTARNDTTGAAEIRTTDQKGRFNLQGGWTAVFEEVPADVDYKVYEDTEAVDSSVTVPDQTGPSGGGVQGILGLLDDMDDMDDTGEEETPEEDNGHFQWPDGWWPTQDTVRTGSTQSPLTALDFHNSNVSFVVTKRLEDYSRPERTRFGFRLSDENNDALGDIPYYLYQTNGEPVYLSEWDNGDWYDPKVFAGGRQILTGRTSYDGTFSLEAGQAAVFVGLKPGQEYRVTETKSPGYTQVLPLPEEDTLHKVTSDGQITTVDFVNRPEELDGMLSVTKNVPYWMEGALNEDVFRFRLYQRLRTEAEVREAFGLSDSGEITEEIIKKGLEENKLVLAVVQNSWGGILLSDMRTDQSSLMLSSKATRAINRGDSDSGGLNKNTNEYFCQIGGNRYEIYVPAGNMLYDVSEGMGTANYRTGPEGEFTLKAEQTAVFKEKISVGDEYLVMETGLTEEYYENILLWAPYRDVYRSWPEEDSAETVKAQKGTIASSSDLGTGGAHLTFQNAYSPRKIDLVLTKTDGEGTAIADREAHFMLYRSKGKESPVLPSMEDIVLDPEVDLENELYWTEEGGLTIPNLKAGTYWLYELKAPSGYCLLPEPVEIHLAWTESGLSITIDGVTYEPGEPQEESESKTIVYSRPSGPANDAVGGVSVEERVVDIPMLQMTMNRPMVVTTVNLEIRNTELYELPNSGGIGIYWYSIGGTLLMMAATLILYKYQRRGGAERSR